MGKNTLIVTGFSAYIGCESTVRYAADRDIKVIVPSDGVSARDLPDMGWGPIQREDVLRFALTNWTLRFARVVTIEELISGLL